jgi:hypothetical protein
MACAMSSLGLPSSKSTRGRDNSRQYILISASVFGYSMFPVFFDFGHKVMQNINNLQIFNKKT